MPRKPKVITKEVIKAHKVIEGRNCTNLNNFMNEFEKVFELQGIEWRRTLDDLNLLLSNKHTAWKFKEPFDIVILNGVYAAAENRDWCDILFVLMGHSNEGIECIIKTERKFKGVTAFMDLTH